MIKVHHLNCATLCPFGQYFVNGTGSLLQRGEMVCHCLLLETNAGLILIDTGFGTCDIADPKHLGRAFRTLINPVLRPNETALYQIRQLGFSPNEVRHIVLTHLHLDHAGGISDFPHAQIHVFAPEYDYAMKPTRRMDKDAYLPHHFRHSPQWQLYHLSNGEKWQGFESINAIAGLQDEILLVPLVGHSVGHCAVAIKTANGWLLHCGDAYFNHQEIQPTPHCPMGLRLFQGMMQYNGKSRLHNQARLRQLNTNQTDIKIFCSHDVAEFALLSTN
jgi:glyoxylase-like metal-dependent hydrolase (beta-lactamase superfamily II)